MFGTLRAEACQLGEERAAYRRLYCGTCSALGQGYGELARPLLSYDVVLLATVIEALSLEPAATGRCRCPAAGYLVHRDTLGTDAVSTRVAAAVQLVLADQWLADQALDGQRTLAVARRWSRQRAARARVELATLGLTLSAADGLAERQKALEARCDALLPEAAAAPTAALLASLFADLGGLPGVGPEASTPRAQEALARLGHAIGVGIYLVDALEDLEKDLCSGDFNPCLDASRRLVPARVASACELLERSLAEIADAVAELPLLRHRAIVENVLCRRLPARARAAMARAMRLAASDTLAPAPERAWPVAVLVACWGGLVAVVSGAWAWLWRRVRRRSSCAVDSGRCAPSPGLVLAMAAPGDGVGGGADGPGGGNRPDLSPEALDEIAREAEKRRRASSGYDTSVDTVESSCDCCCSCGDLCDTCGRCYRCGGNSSCGDCCHCCDGNCCSGCHCCDICGCDGCGCDGCGCDCDC